MMTSASTALAQHPEPTAIIQGVSTYSFIHNYL